MNAVALVAGLLFALGLGIGGMTQPTKVIGFLDVAGSWDPSLALVMAGALLVYGPLARLTLARGAPLLAPAFSVPTRRDIDRPLLVGATLFGVGWGIAGYCPGPALVSLASGRGAAVVFVAAMLLGMWLEQRWTARRTHPVAAGAAVAATLLALLVGTLAPAAAARPQGSVRDDMLVTTEWLAAHAGEPGLVVLHVGRTRDAYDRGHVPGARFIAFAEVATARHGVTNELPGLAELIGLVRRLGITGEAGERIVIYGEDEGLQAARVYVALDYLGLAAHAALLDGQWAAWQAEQRPLSTDAGVVAASTVVPQVDPGRIVAVNLVEDVAAAKTSLPGWRTALVDARPAAQYAGAEGGAGAPPGGHIPGAVNVFWKENLRAGDVPRLRPAAELQALYEKAGVAPGALVITYCRTGVQASYAYFVLTYLGYDARLYDGSFDDWSAVPGTTVAR